MANIPLVSILIITYNHERYVEDEIDSVLRQKTDFKYELIIGDNFFTDNARNILRKY